MSCKYINSHFTELGLLIVQFSRQRGKHDLVGAQVRVGDGPHELLADAGVLDWAAGLLHLVLVHFLKFLVRYDGGGNWDLEDVVLADDTDLVFD